MAQAMKQAVEATRENNAVVERSEGKVLVRCRRSVPIEIDDLIRKKGWLISPRSARNEALVVFKSQ